MRKQVAVVLQPILTGVIRGRAGDFMACLLRRVRDGYMSTCHQAQQLQQGARDTGSRVLAFEQIREHRGGFLGFMRFAFFGKTVQRGVRGRGSLDKPGCVIPCRRRPEIVGVFAIHVDVVTHGKSAVHAGAVTHETNVAPGKAP